MQQAATATAAKGLLDGYPLQSLMMVTGKRILPFQEPTLEKIICRMAQAVMDSVSRCAEGFKKPHQ